MTFGEMVQRMTAPMRTETDDAHEPLHLMGTPSTIRIGMGGEWQITSRLCRQNPRLESGWWHYSGRFLGGL